MKISFISTVKDEEKNILRYLESVLGQTRKPDEILIVDGGSKDNTLKVVNSLKSKSKIPIRVFVEPGANIAKGRNIAIKKAKYDLIFASDAGCVVDRNWIRETLNFFPDADVVAGNYSAITKNDFEYFQSIVSVNEVDRISRMSSRNIAFKKECWKKVGGYPEKSLTGEDTGFNLKLQRAGFEIKINPKKLVSWEMRPTLTKFVKQFYSYGKGDKRQGNLLKMKKNMAMVFGFWVYLLLAVNFLFYAPLLGIILVILPLLYFLMGGFLIGIKTKKTSAILYLPLLLLAKRLGYILGASFG